MKIIHYVPLEAPVFGSGGETTAFMVVNRNYRKGATAAWKVALPGNRIHELDRKTGQWSQGEQLARIGPARWNSVPATAGCSGSAPPEAP